jgi:hypothetical protein
MPLEIVLESVGTFDLIVDKLKNMGVETDADYSGVLPHSSFVDPDNNPITIMVQRNPFE